MIIFKNWKYGGLGVELACYVYDPGVSPQHR